MKVINSSWCANVVIALTTFDLLCLKISDLGLSREVPINYYQSSDGEFAVKVTVTRARVFPVGRHHVDVYGHCSPLLSGSGQLPKA